mmetsp:Transcript_26969/g.76515  ORF Transcript_26969/g.76515 Transcript_26969/m.76515 type:complete len:209 (-) Transcript_26969:131-757(-)
MICFKNGWIMPKCQRTAAPKLQKAKNAKARRATSGEHVQQQHRTNFPTRPKQTAASLRPLWAFLKTFFPALAALCCERPTSPTKPDPFADLGDGGAPACGLAPALALALAAPPPFFRGPQHIAGEMHPHMANIATAPPAMIMISNMFFRCWDPNVVSLVKPINAPSVTLRCPRASQGIWRCTTRCFVDMSFKVSSTFRAASWRAAMSC